MDLAIKIILSIIACAGYLVIMFTMGFLALKRTQKTWGGR